MRDNVLCRHVHHACCAANPNKNYRWYNPMLPIKQSGVSCFGCISVSKCRLKIECCRNDFFSNISVISVPSQITAITLIPLELLPLQLYVLPFSGSTSVPPCRNGRRGIMHPWCEFEEQICGVDCLAGEIHLHGRARGVPRRR